MKRLVILAIASLLVAPAAYGDAQTGLQNLGQLFGRDRQILLIPEAGGDDHVFTSLENFGSFGGFQNTNDYAYSNEADLALLTGDESTRMLKTPSADGEGRARVIFTNLTNYARQSDLNVIGPGNQNTNITALQLGTVSKVGPGNLAVGFAYQNATNETSCSGSATGAGVAPNCAGAYLDNSEPRVDLSLAYGFKLGEPMALGFSLRYANAEHELVSTTIPAGAPAALNQITTNDDPWNAFRLAGAFRWDMSDSLSWNVRLTYDTVKAEDNTMLQNVAGNVRAFEVSRDQVGLMGRVNFYGDNSDYEVFLGFASGSGTVDNARMFGVDAMGMPTQAATDERWTDDATTTNFYIGARGMYRLGKADFTPALLLESITGELEVASIIGQSTSPSTRAKNENTVTRFSIPFAARYWFTEKFAVGAGARWTMISDDDETTNTGIGMNPADTVTTVNNTKQSATISMYRLFMRYGNEHFSGQLLFANNLNAVSEPSKIDSPDSQDNFQRSNVSLDTVAVMVNISF